MFDQIADELDVAKRNLVSKLVINYLLFLFMLKIVVSFDIFIEVLISLSLPQTIYEQKASQFETKYNEEHAKVSIAFLLFFILLKKAGRFVSRTK